MNLETFLDQIRRVAKRIVSDAGVDKQVEEFFSQIVGKLASPTARMQEIVKDTAAKFINLLLSATPVFSTALFRVFGD